MDLKGILAIVVGCVLAVGAALFCGIYFGLEPKYEAVTRITYSTDGGYNYREGIQEFKVGETFYMCIEMQVVSSKNVKNGDITATIIIPRTKIVECSLDDYQGPKITGNEDPINGITTYEFKVPSSTAPAKFRVIFECIPSEVGKQMVEIQYDDRLPSTQWKVETLKYIEGD